ncbi:MAG: DUF483 domain-containing protein [Nanoarchaeota archaeon]|nr:DUF483 domain-containing protein [Nanoarchaeota archaeon]MBU1977101.1 DUF483 domain-containing protein [Nanoarchaeota archaeon]
MIKKLSLIFGSKTKAEEIIYLLSGLKKVVRQGYYEPELPKIEKFCKEKDFYLIKSKFKVLLADETNYSNKGIKIKEDDKRAGMYFVYISKEEKEALLASYYELIDNYKELGSVLGYPRCCVDFFVRNFNENNINLQQIPSNLYTNITKRENDCVLISHFPCSSGCEESIKIGVKNLQAITEIDQTRAEELSRELKC